VGLALRDAVGPIVDVPLGIKWTNDLIACGRKLAGILVESILEEGRLSALVVGIGLNVHMVELPSEIAQIATSLRLLGCTRLDREQILVDILGALNERMHQYAAQGIAGIIDELRACDAIRGMHVRVGNKSGLARGLDEEGALLLETTEGAPPEHLTNGLVEYLSWHD
jgi:BirA family biotin operon repressor/biotin-[acetyl-CoA-carboxylase] ligase